jgi:quercetin 2,3-dioxygenase
MTQCDETRDGDDVRVFRCVGGNDNEERKRMTLDPFLVFDVYRSERREEFEKGFPAHAHRGFLELRYITHGWLAHNDSCKNRGITGNGGVQALFTGSGIVHEELPIRKYHEDRCGSVELIGDDVGAACHEGESEPEDGNPDVFRGFQVWMNVPEERRNEPPRYKTYASDTFPRYTLPQRLGSVTLFSGRWPGSPQTIGSGPISDLLDWHHGLLFAQLQLKASIPSQWLTLDLPRRQHVLLYSLNGNVLVGDDDEETIQRETFAFLGPGNEVRLRCLRGSANHPGSCDVLILTAPRVQERVVVSGGFVAGNDAALRQAFRDLQEGNSTHC